MEFCPRCGAILIEKKKNLGCLRCSYSHKGKIKIKTTETMTAKDKNKEIPILKDKDANVFPIISAACKKCGHNQAYFWTVQTRSGDEAETKFFKCTKCEHTWREYR
ncbi:MAG: transcription factor S [Nanoarchaeota archaeon]